MACSKQDTCLASKQRQRLVSKQWSALFVEHTDTISCVEQAQRLASKQQICLVFEQEQGPHTP